MDSYRILEIVLSVAVPLLILVAGWLWSQHRENIHKNETLEATIKNTEKSDIHEQLSTLENMINRTTEQLDRLSDKVDSLTTSQSKITSMNRLNGRYTHELAQLVMTLSEGIRDQHLDGNITKAINKYRSFEEHTLGNIVGGGEGISPIDTPHHDS